MRMKSAGVARRPPRDDDGTRAGGTRSRIPTHVATPVPIGAAPLSSRGRRPAPRDAYIPMDGGGGGGVSAFPPTPRIGWPIQAGD